MAVWDEYQWHSSATSIQMPHADATINALDNQVQYWHISMPHFPRYMQLYETNHHAISNLWISNPCAGIEPAERETRTTTVDRACRVRRVGWTRSVRRRGTTVNALAFLKATYVRAKYDIWHAPAGESHATNAQRQGNSDKNANTKWCYLHNCIGPVHNLNQVHVQAIQKHGWYSSWSTSIHTYYIFKHY